MAGGYGLGLGIAARVGLAKAPSEPRVLKALKTEVALTRGAPTKDVLTYGEAAMPPTLRLTKGEPFAARLANALDEATTIHWHGLRIANGMDGVPFLTQPYVNAGESFDYAFTPPDAGTFWYHPHCNTLMQMGHGLTGVIVVEDPADPAFDSEIVLNMRDWRLGNDSQFIAQFLPRNLGKSGTFGTVRTTNWLSEPQYDAPAGGLVRLRIAATDVTRIYRLGLQGAEAVVIALDGHPVPARFPLETLLIGPGQRLDLALRMPDTEGTIVTLEDSKGTSPRTVATLRAVGASLKRALGDLAALAPNPVQKADVRDAKRIPLVLSATAESVAVDSFCGSLGYSFWAINKVPWPGDSANPTDPLAELKLGKSYVLELENRTPHVHPIHLHGMSFTVLSSSSREVAPQITDTYLINADERVELALVADNPGDWAFHCHIIEHQKTGMTGYLRVA
jgi:FtsP/CotA-like multicopper oxidase with cupredoxin domain